MSRGRVFCGGLLSHRSQRWYHSSSFCILLLAQASWKGIWQHSSLAASYWRTLLASRGHRLSISQGITELRFRFHVFIRTISISLSTCTCMPLFSGANNHSCRTLVIFDARRGLYFEKSTLLWKIGISTHLDRRRDQIGWVLILSQSCSVRWWVAVVWSSCQGS